MPGYFISQVPSSLSIYLVLTSWPLHQRKALSKELKTIVVMLTPKRKGRLCGHVKNYCVVRHAHKTARIIAIVLNKNNVGAFFIEAYVRWAILDDSCKAGVSALLYGRFAYDETLRTFDVVDHVSIPLVSGW